MNKISDILVPRKKVIIISSYRPRDCGIATFSFDLATSIERFSGLKTEIIPMNEFGHENRKYNSNIRRTISCEDKDSYLSAASYINKSEAIALVLQHEYGLFGGEKGEYILDLLDLVKKPIITTFHTVLSEPDQKQKEVLQKIADKSDTVVVMAQVAADILMSVYAISANKIEMIHHGVPEVPFGNQIKAKKKIGLENDLIISTYGFLGSGKGLENIISALPAVVQKYPNLKYLMLGLTHPQILKSEGEKYRDHLTAEINKLGLTDHVIQYNRFLKDEDIALYLSATDIYITPYLNPQQITSGTLARAVSTGRACISTSYTYAKEILSDDRGLLVPFGDSDAIANAIITLLADDKKRREMERLNYLYSRPMTWESVAKRYIELLQRLILIESDETSKSPTKPLAS